VLLRKLLGERTGILAEHDQPLLFFSVVGSREGSYREVVEVLAEGPVEDVGEIVDGDVGVVEVSKRVRRGGERRREEVLVRG
jgi:hypothetical protein